jgi:TonB family protein
VRHLPEARFWITLRTDDRESGRRLARYAPRTRQESKLCPITARESQLRCGQPDPHVRLRERKLGAVFVSYRRSDSQGEAGRLFDDLVKHFGEHMVFMDVVGIEAGRDFRKAIEESVAKCGVLLVVVGPEWLNAKDERGARRLDDPADFVRIETAAALRRDIPVIPVLVRAARMPSAEHLPEGLKELAYRNCIELTHARWRSDIQLLIDALRRLLGDSIQAGTRVGANGATASARRTQQGATESSKPEDGGSARIDPAAVQQVTRELALRIGPIADIVVKRAASRCNSIEDLYLEVADEIDSPDDRQKFLLKRVPIPPIPFADVPGAAIPAKNTSGPIGSLPLPEGGAVPHKTASPATGTRLSSRWKYLLLTSAGSVLLILMLVLGIRFFPSKVAGPSQTPQTSPQETQEESAPVKAGTPPPPAEASGPATRPTDKSEPRSPQRVRVPQEVSRELLITTILPVYPPLARQAHVQGTVVLDADISKAGIVETLRAVSGHPMLIPAAVDAVKQWRYKPYVLKGEPVAVNTQIVVNFTLSGG